MSYDIQVNAGVQGLPQLQQLGTETEKQVDRTKKLDDALKEYLAKHDRLIKAQQDYAAQQAKIAELTERFWDQQNAGMRRLAAAQDAAAKENEKRANAEAEAFRKLAALQDAAARENERRAATAQKQNEEFAASIKQWVQDPLGAAGNAAEQFALKYGAAGAAVAGSMAGLAAVGTWLVKNASDTGKYALEISNLAQRTGMTTTETQLYSRAAEVAGVNANTLTTAIRTLSRGLSENTDEGKKQKEVLRELGFSAADAYKPMGELLPQIFQRLSAVTSEVEKERMTVTLLGRSGLELVPLMGRFQELENRVKQTGVVMDEQGIQKTKEYDEQLRLLGLQWDALKLKLGEKTVGVIELVIRNPQLLSAPLDFGTGAAGNAIGQWIANSTNSLVGLGGLIAGDLPAGPDAPGARGGPSTEQMRREINASRLRAYNLSNMDPRTRIQEELRSLSGEREQAEQRFLGAEPGSQKSAAELAELSRIDARTKALKDQEQALKDETKATRELASEKEREIEIAKRSREMYDKAFFGDEAAPQRTYAQARARIASERADAIRRNPSQAAGINQAFDLQEEAAFVTFLREAGDALQKFRDEAEKGITLGEKMNVEQQRELEKAARKPLDLGFVQQAPTPEAGYVSPQEALRIARDTGRRNLQLFGAQSRLAGLSEADQAQGLYDLRAKTAQDEYEADLRIARQKHDLSLESDALAKKEQALFDARLDHENALLEIAAKQKEEFQSFAVGLVNAGRSGSVGSFLRGQINKIEDTIVSTLAGAAWKDISKIVPHAKAGTALGDILQGTPFGPDPLKTAGSSLNTAGQNLSSAARDLTAAARNLSRGGSGGSAGSGGGLPGIGGGGGGGYSETDSSVYGLPTDGAGNGDYGGEYGPAVSVPGAGLSALQVAGLGAAGIAGGMGIYSGLSSGGVRGGLQAAGSAAGLAGVALPALAGLSAAGPIGLGIAAGIGLITSLLGDPKAARENDIQKQLTTSQFFQPVSINASMGTNGGYSDFDRFGGVRSSDLSPFPTVQEPYALYRQGITVPGRTLSQFGGPGPAPAPITVNITAFDSQDVHRALNNNTQALGDAMARSFELGHATRFQELNAAGR